MSRDEVHIRDRLLFLAERSNPHKPFNVKRKSTLTKQGSKSGPKLSMQDFVRMDPGYTPDIEHLVFPARKRNPQQVAPMNPPASKTRSRLAEMFALSRHLQQRSQDREAKGRGGAVNRSIDSAMEARVALGLPSGRAVTADATRRWVSQVEEPVRLQNTSTSRISPAAESDMAAARGPNVSVLHLRSTTTDPWEAKQSSIYTTAGIASSNKSYPPKSSVPQLTKHQSLGGAPSSYRWMNSSNFHSGGEVNSTDLFGSGNVNRELSPVRWCDREVDGVYLGRSGWVQVQQRSLDESRRAGYATTSSLLPSKRTGIKLADYHAKSEPASKYADVQKVPEVTTTTTTSRPGYLSFPTKEFEKRRTPSPQPLIENLSPPPVTPIISPPPAFQDKNKKTLTKAKTFFGKAPFLPRSNAIDSDEISPPPTPKHIKYKSMSMPAHTRRSEKPIIVTIPEPPREPPQGYGRVPQMRSMDDKSAARRWLFVQRHESSSSSSSSMGFRSLDSVVNRPAMPRLSENTDSSIDREVYEDADEEDNNSSSINVSVINMKLMDELNRPKEKISPSGRTNRSIYHRDQLLRPEPSKPRKTASPGSSSSSSNEFPSRRSPSGSAQQSRRTTPIRQYQPPKPPAEDPSLSRVRRSRSLQLPDKRVPQMYREMTKVSPQHPERSGIKMGTQVKRRQDSVFTEEDMMREAEVVTGFLYGNRTRAAAQALLQQRYGSIKGGKEEKSKEASSKPNGGIAVYFVNPPKKERQKVLHRGSTTPNLRSTSTQVDPPEPCTADTCDFWPHCAHLNRDYHMRSSQSYPTHQMSLDSVNKRRGDFGKQAEVVRRVSPNKAECVYEKKGSPLSMFGSSSSSSDLWLAASDRALNRAGKRGSGASTPLDDVHVFGESKREMILTRPGSAPTEQRNSGFLESQQRSMSLPKSFLSISHQQG